MPFSNRALLLSNVAELRVILDTVWQLGDARASFSDATSWEFIQSWGIAQSLKVTNI